MPNFTKILSFTILTALAVFSVLFMPLFAKAQSLTDQCTKFGLPNIYCIRGIQIQSGPQFFVYMAMSILQWITAIAGILAVGVIVWSAILFLTAGGDENRRKTAGAWLKYGIIGIIVAILAFTIISIVTSFLLM